MKRATFIFQGDLTSFLTPQNRANVYQVGFKGNQSVKHLIEAAGIPHTEVAQIRVNQNIVGFNYIVEDGDFIEIFPFRFNTPGNDLPEPSENKASDDPSAHFILDNHLGKLAIYLRMLGFDCLYDNSLVDQTLAEVACQQERILLTRDRRLLMRKMISKGYCIRSLLPEQQIREVLERFKLTNHIHPFCRCLRCNQVLVPIAKELILDRLQPLTRKYFNEYHHCKNCDQIYWKGSHYERMMEFIQNFQANQ